MKNPFAVVVTTIQSPTPALKCLAGILAQSSAPLIIVGDAKGPADFSLPGSSFISLNDQIGGDYDLGRLSPTSHYSRKNIGYLEAIGRGAGCIYETDDDNAPLSHWARRECIVIADRVAESGWVNAYRCYSDSLVWPRGFPLDEIVGSTLRPPLRSILSESVNAPIQQGLANGSPDVDAVWRLVLDRHFDFDDGPSVVLPPGSWCPFNSQSTWWWTEAFPLLYLPSYCSFRMTDIWRSFVAQRCLWELGHGVVFHAAEVVQDRNLHNLMRDFNDEIPGYQRNRELVQVLADTTLLPGAGAVGDNLQRCYEALVYKGFFAKEELDLLAAWRSGLELALRGG